MIAKWHGFLDYDKKLPQRKRDAIRLDREKKKTERLKLDAMRISKAEATAREAKEKADIEQKTRREQREIENRRYELTPPNQRKPACPFCGCEMTRKSQSTDSGIGCLILIIGLVFSPFLIGIPLLFVGIHYMSKKRTIVACPKCGIENGRAF